MLQTLLIFIGIVILVVLVMPKTRSKIGGICSVTMDQTLRKNKNKEKILELLNQQNELSNSDIRQALGVSSATVTRYMDQLENEGKIIQHGDKKSSYYTKNH